MLRTVSWARTDGFGQPRGGSLDQISTAVAVATMLITVLPLAFLRRPIARPAAPADRVRRWPMTAW
jgi:hypothetical protein